MKTKLTKDDEGKVFKRIQSNGSLMTYRYIVCVKEEEWPRYHYRDFCSGRWTKGEHGYFQEGWFEDVPRLESAILLGVIPK